MDNIKKDNEVDGIVPIAYTQNEPDVVHLPNIYHMYKYNVLCQLSGMGEVFIMGNNGWMNREEFVAQSLPTKPRWSEKMSVFRHASFEGRDIQLARFDEIAEAVLKAHHARQ